jgi:hypothetical protein
MEPEKRRKTVGQPPITGWILAVVVFAFSVVFCYYGRVEKGETGAWRSAAPLSLVGCW